jgi:hypothetical protein
MRYTDDQLGRIFERTSGRCHLCAKRLARRNYGTGGLRGSWEVDHSVATVNGGANHGNNLFAACVSCNRRKQANTSRSARRGNGLTRAPLSTGDRERRRNGRILNGATLGLIGGIFGPAGWVVGPLVGGLLAAGGEDE